MKPTLKRMIRKREVGPFLANLTRSSVDELIKNDPTFPRLVYLSERCPAFVEDELAAWQAARLAERDRKASSK